MWTPEIGTLYAVPISWYHCGTHPVVLIWAAVGMSKPSYVFLYFVLYIRCVETAHFKYQYIWQLHLPNRVNIPQILINRRSQTLTPSSSGTQIGGIWVMSVIKKKKKNWFLRCMFHLHVLQSGQELKTYSENLYRWGLSQGGYLP